MIIMRLFAAYPMLTVGSLLCVCMFYCVTVCVFYCVCVCVCVAVSFMVIATVVLGCICFLWFHWLNYGLLLYCVKYIGVHDQTNCIASYISLFLCLHLSVCLSFSVTHSVCSLIFMLHICFILGLLILFCLYV